MLPQLVQHPLNGLYVLFTFALDVDEDVIEVYYYKNVELFCQDLVDVARKCGRYIGQSKRHDLIFKVTIVSLKGCLTFITFLDLHLMVGIGLIELCKMSSPT